LQEAGPSEKTGQVKLQSGGQEAGPSEKTGQVKLQSGGQEAGVPGRWAEQAGGRIEIGIRHRLRVCSAACEDSLK
jgi:hypothetical protein